MSQLYERELETGIDAVIQAAKVCQQVQSSITADVLEKQDKSPVTVADFASQAIICRALKASFPEDPVIGEEDSQELGLPENAVFLDRIQQELASIGIESSGEEVRGWIDRGGSGSYSNRFWTLDPIDGTKGFLRGEQYAISLALIVKGEISVAILGCPNLPQVPGDNQTAGTLLYAVRGAGSFIKPLSTDGTATAINVSQNSHSAEARLCESVESGHSSHSHSAQVAELLNITQEPVRLDSQAKYATVARGEADIYLRLPTRKNYNEKIWDHAGGVLVVEEAGGRVTDISGKPLEFQHGRELINNRGVIVTNSLLHEQVLAALPQVGIE